MIEHLDGIFESVDFHGQKGIRIHYHKECENFPHHWHTPVEIIRATDNWYIVKAGDSVYQLAPGDIALIRPGTIHALEAPKEGARTIFLVDVSGVKAMGDLETLLSILPPVTVVQTKEEGFYERISVLLEKVEEEYASRMSFYEVHIYSALLELLGVLGRRTMSGLPEAYGENISSLKNGKRLMEVCHYINDHCTEGLTLSQVADIAGFSKYHFTRIFKEFTHTSFYQYLNEKRISHAEQMLVNPDYSVTEVAVHSGFSSLPAFIRMFKQWKGCTPTEFRSMYSPDGMNPMNKKKSI